MLVFSKNTDFLSELLIKNRLNYNRIKFSDFLGENIIK